MHALIYGTGKWAKLIGSKLNFPKYYIGSNSDIANFSRRDKLPKELKQGIVFISSKTEDHFNDYKLSLKHKPGLVLIEKGFSCELDYENAKKFSSKVPTFIMNQYRYSKVFETLKEKVTDIKK